MDDVVAPPGEPIPVSIPVPASAVSQQATQDSPTAVRITHALERLGRVQRVERQRLASQHGLSPLQVDILMLLHHGLPPQPTVGVLAQELSITQPTVTDSIRTLESKGLIIRTTAITDRRRTVIELSHTGTVLTRRFSELPDDVTQAVAALPFDEHGPLLEALLGVIEHLVVSGTISVARTCTTCRFYSTENATHHCSLLDADLQSVELRVNCPDHEAASA